MDTIETPTAVKSWRLSCRCKHTVTFEGSGHNINLQPEINYKPVNTLSLSFNPSYMVSYDELQYVDQTTYGNQPRYIYGSIDQKVVSMSLQD